MSDLQDTIAQEIWQRYVVEVGRSLPEGLADKLAAAVVDALGMAQEWSDDVAGPEWQRYSRWVTKTIAHPGPRRIAAGLT